jgi:hypothetical protein
MTRLMPVLIVVLLVSASVQGASLLTWDFAGFGGSSSVAAQVADPGISTAAPSGVASIGPGLLAINYLGNGLTARDLTAVTLDAALAGDDYISFSIAAADAGATLSLESVELRPVSQNRTRSFALLSDVDGFGAGNVIGSFDYAGNFGPAERIALPTAFSGLTAPVEFRLYIYGYDNPWEAVGLGNSDAGTGGPEDLVILGSVVSGGPVPEPITMFGALGAIGAVVGYVRRRIV